MDIVFGITPVASRIEIAETHGFLQASFDPCGRQRDLASYKVFAASGTFVVVTDGVAEKESVRFAIDPCHLRRKGLCTAVG